MNHRKLAMGLAIAAVLVAVAGCGRRGALEAPPDLTVAPRAAASERLVTPVASVNTTDAGSLDNRHDELLVADPSANRARAAEVAPAPVDPNKPRKRFFLDALVE